MYDYLNDSKYILIDFSAFPWMYLKYFCNMSKNYEYIFSMISVIILSNKIYFETQNILLNFNMKKELKLKKERTF